LPLMVVAEEVVVFMAMVNVHFALPGSLHPRSVG
jgi:hypothetical protein